MAYRAANLSIVPSDSLEGFGLIVAESLAAGTPAGTLSNDLSGEPTLYASDYSAALFADYVFTMNNGMEWFASMDVNYRDDFGSAGDNDPIDEIDSYTKVNLRLGLRGESWEVMAYGRNIFDDQSIRPALVEHSGWPTTPQVYIDGEFIGGSDIVLELYQNGELQKKLETVSSQPDG